MESPIRPIVSGAGPPSRSTRWRPFYWGRFRAFSRTSASASCCSSLQLRPRPGASLRRTDNAYWAVVNAGSCSLILNAGALYLSPDARYSKIPTGQPSSTWSGPQHNGLASGRGTMTIAVYFKENAFVDRLPLDLQGRDRATGVMTGVFETQTTNNDGTGNSPQLPGRERTFTIAAMRSGTSAAGKFADARALQARFGVSGRALALPMPAAPPTPPGRHCDQAADLRRAAGKCAGDGDRRLVSSLGGRSGLSFSTGDATIDTILASLQARSGAMATRRWVAGATCSASCWAKRAGRSAGRAGFDQRPDHRFGDGYGAHRDCFGRVRPAVAAAPPPPTPVAIAPPPARASSLDARDQQPARPRVENGFGRRYPVGDPRLSATKATA